MSRKGLVKTLEAVIAVLLILGLLVFILPQEKVPTGEVPAEIKSAQRYVLDEISLNQAYRDCITKSNANYHGKCEPGCLGQIENLVISNAPFGYTGSCEVCDTALSCAVLQLPADKSVYTDSIFISNKPTTKVLRVYFYEK